MTFGAGTGRLERHIFPLAEVAVPRKLFAALQRVVRGAQAATVRVPASLFWGNRCYRSSSGVSSAVGAGAEAQGGVHLSRWFRAVAVDDKSFTAVAVRRLA